MVVQRHLSSVDGRGLHSTAIVCEAAVRLARHSVCPEVSGVGTLLETVAEPSCRRHKAATMKAHWVLLCKHRSRRAAFLIPNMGKGLV